MTVVHPAGGTPSAESSSTAQTQIAMTRALRTALVAVLASELTDPNVLALAVFSADQHAQSLAQEVTA